MLFGPSSGVGAVDSPGVSACKHCGDGDRAPLMVLGSETVAVCKESAGRGMVESSR